MINCKFCGNDCEPVESHIIPASFFRGMKSGAEPLNLLSNTKGVYPSKSHTGIYDRFLCSHCERRFDKYDDYGIKLLRGFRTAFRPVHQVSGKLVGFTTREYDYNLLKLFLISVLWRASASAHPFFKRIDLGPFESKARLSIEHGDPGDEQHFSPLLSCWAEGQNNVPLHMAIMDPFEERWRGIRAVRLYFGEFLAHIKVDRRPAIDPMDKFILRPGHDLVVIARDPSKSAELRNALNVLKASQNMA